MSKRGRLPDSERKAREQAILDAAMAELIERGYDKVTMLAVAKRAGASKETLYSWFGNKVGLFQTMIEQNGDHSAERVAAAMSRSEQHETVLTGYCEGLITLLTSDVSVALNRASMTSPELAKVLLMSGRHRVGPLVEAYLGRLADEGVLTIDRPADAFELLYGLAVRDTQIRVLLGEAPPDSAAIRYRARDAVAQFLKLSSPG